MRKLRITAALLLLGLLVFVLSGCGESFVYRTYTDAAGGIHKEFTFCYDAELSDAATVKEQALTVMRRYVAELGLAEFATIKDDEAGKVELLLYFPTVTDYEIALGHNGREKPEETEEKYKGLYIEREMLVKSYLEEGTVDKVRAFADEEYADFPLVGEFYYVYGTPNRTIRSNGEVTEVDGIYYHSWRLYPDRDVKMLLRSCSMNGILLYGCIIMLFVLSLGTIFAILYYKKAKQRKENARAVAAQSETGGETPSDPKEE